MIAIQQVEPEPTSGSGSIVYSTTGETLNTPEATAQVPVETTIMRKESNKKVESLKVSPKILVEKQLTDKIDLKAEASFNQVKAGIQFRL